MKERGRGIYKQNTNNSKSEIVHLLSGATTHTCMCTCTVIYSSNFYSSINSYQCTANIVGQTKLINVNALYMYYTRVCVDMQCA